MASFYRQAGALTEDRKKEGMENIKRIRNRIKRQNGGKRTWREKQNERNEWRKWGGEKAGGGSWPLESDNKGVQFSPAFGLDLPPRDKNDFAECALYEK